MDTIANMLTAITNAQAVGKQRVAVPHSRFKESLANLLQQKRLVSAVRIQAGPQPKLILTLNYQDDGRPAITGAKRLSTPGQRRYASRQDIPYALDSAGIIVVSTPQGLMDDRQARRQGIGGELVCEIW